MKKLFIYYSFTGSGEALANIFASKGYEIRKVTPKRNLSKNFTISMFQGGMLSGLKHKAKLIDYNNDISEYDEVVVGSPIWNGYFACPINTVLKKTDFTNKKLSFVLYSGGGCAPKAVKFIKEQYQCNVIELKEPKKYLEDAEKALTCF
ncbi:MAG: hypothetical protein WCR67_00355 [Bacilli bacterium]